MLNTELILNVAWALLTLGALLGCRAVPIRSAMGRVAYRYRGFVLSSCLSVVMFPVVSATDDLSVMLTDMEESTSSNLAVKKLSPCSSPGWSKGSSPPAERVRAGSDRPHDTFREQVSEHYSSCVEHAPTTIAGCRAPPLPVSSVSVAPPTAALLRHVTRTEAAACGRAPGCDDARAAVRKRSPDELGAEYAAILCWKRSGGLGRDPAS